jgi:hypothetical protein
MFAESRFQIGPSKQLQNNQQLALRRPPPYARKRARFRRLLKREGIWNCIHVDHAAAATCAAVNSDAGVYNVVDNRPMAQSVWLPAFQDSLGHRRLQPFQNSKQQ